MRHILGLALGVGFLLFAGAIAAWAQGEAGAPPPPIDETTGSGTFRLVNGATSVQGGIIGLCEGPLTNNQCLSTLSDVLVIQPLGVGFGQFFFASDLEGVQGESGLAADTGIPQGITINKLLPEVVNENGGEVIDYQPGSLDPGAQFDAAGNFISGVHYSITSDPSPVPEPSTVALLVAGMGPCALGYLRARARVKNAPNAVKALERTAESMRSWAR